MIRTLDQMAGIVRDSGRKYRIAIARAEDTNSLSAISRAVSEGFAEAFLVGAEDSIKQICIQKGIDYRQFNLVNVQEEQAALRQAVQMVKTGEADIIMKGLVGTDKFLREIMNKQDGLMIPGAVMSYVCAIEVPAYSKLLFLTDPAVIPFPNLEQKVAMAGYAIDMAHRFGIERPRVALVSATEKVSIHFGSSSDYTSMLKMAQEGRFGDCIMDGPLDIFLACDPKSPGIKGVSTPVGGEADVLLFPSLESGNPFYKGLMLFAGGELAGLIRGTEKPVVVMSRSESERSKYYCIALACMMASK